MFKEWLLRLNIWFGSPDARDPERFGQQLIGDDFWILAGRWDTYCNKIARERIHPRLGWSQGPISQANPMGLVPWTTDRMKHSAVPKVLFFGDSYVDGEASQENWLPTLLEGHLAGMHVLHLGVGGYGTGQMHLLAKDILPQVNGCKWILMGVEPHSFDRAGLRVRSYQKPRLVVDSNGSLEVTNLPINPDPENFYKYAQLSFRSYLKAEERLLETPPSSTDFGFRDKVLVNKAIIKANQSMATESGARLLYVLFRNQPEIEQENSRTQFFLDELQACDIDVFDTKATLQEHARRAGTDASELYRNGHYNDQGNLLIAQALADHIKHCGS